MRVTADDGHIYLSTDLREKFGTEFELVDRGDRLLLIPVPDGPLETLRGEASDTDSSVEELKQAAVEQGCEDAGV